MELAARSWNSGLCLVPVGREFEDYHELVVAYVAAITGEAQRIDPNASVYGNAVLVGDEVGPFEYADVASVRARTTALTAKLASAGPIGIVGLGGTGSYVLDLVAKTPVPAIHLFDGDEFLQHNAFRAPGLRRSTICMHAGPRSTTSRPCTRPCIAASFRIGASSTSAACRCSEPAGSSSCA
jgi:hypothetical protein